MYGLYQIKSFKAILRFTQNIIFHINLHLYFPSVSVGSQFSLLFHMVLSHICCHCFAVILVAISTLFAVILVAITFADRQGV